MARFQDLSFKLSLCLVLALVATIQATIVGQLLVLDATGNATTVKVVDIPTGVVTGTLSFPVTPALYSSGSGRYAFISMASRDLIQIYDSGIIVKMHNGHHDLELSASKMLNLNLTQQRPSHVDGHADYTLVFNDGSGTVTFVHEPTLAAMGDHYEPSTVLVGKQHGAASSFGGGDFAITNPNPVYALYGTGSSLPLGVKIWSFQGVIYDEAANACPGLHGESCNGKMCLWGCSDGLLAITKTGHGYHHFKINYPATLSGRLGTTWGHDLQDNFFAGSPAIGLYIVRPAARTMTLLHNSTLPTSTQYASGNIHFNDDGNLVVLFRSGHIHIYDTVTGGLIRVIKVVNSVTNTDPTPPRMSVAFGNAYVSVPSLGRVLVVSLAKGKVTSTVTLGGKPTSLIALGPKEEWEHL